MSISKALDKSGVQNFWEKIKKVFITKEEAEEQFLTSKNIDVDDVVFKSKNVYGVNNESNSGNIYYPGLVPQSNSNSSTSLFLNNKGVWDSPFTVDAGSFTHGSSGSQTISSNIKGKKYIEILDSNGAVVIAAKIGATGTYSITSICSKIGSVTSANSTSVNIQFGNSSGNGTYYWKIFGTP